MLQHCYRQLARLLLIALIAGLFPQIRPTALAATRKDDPTPPPIVRTVAPFVDPHRPSLTLHIDVAPNPVVVGATATISLTVINGAPDPADDLVVMLQLPDGAQALPGPNTLDSGQGWRWAPGHLDGQGHAILTADVRLVQMPRGEALLLKPQLTAQGMGMPIQEVGGAVAIDGAAAIDDVRGAARMPFAPGRAAVLRSRDGHIQVHIPARAAPRALMLRHATIPPPGEIAPPALPGFKRGFGTFFLDATDEQGQALHQFSEPLTISVGYTPEQLQALGIAEGDLTLYWFDDQKQQWAPLRTSVDSAARTASAVVDHFSKYQLSDGSSPSDAYIPSLQGWQVSPFTGAATYAYPLDIPAGPNGVRPQLELTYNSGQTDGPGGIRSRQQAGWVGKGWSLTTGAVARRKVLVNDDDDNGVYFSLVLNGQSFDLVGTLRATHPTNGRELSEWDWRPTNENFMRVQVVQNGVSDATRGGHDIMANKYETRYKWQLWAKDGTLYEFKEDLWWGWSFCDRINGTGGFARSETYKWLLSSVTDPHGNVITYTYARDSWPKTSQPSDVCYKTAGGISVANYNYSLIADRDAWPTSITWGRNAGVSGSVDRYKVEFISTTRPDGYDTAWDDSDTYQYYFRDGQPRETQMLRVIRVWSMPASTWQVVREYQLKYADYPDPTHTQLLYADNSPTNYNKLTLKRIIPIGRYEPDDTELPALPETTFTYQADPGTQALIKGGWNRLQTVNNGYGGTITFAYDHIAQIYFDRSAGCTPNCLFNYNLFRNFHRVKSRTVADGQNHSYTWTYTYGEAAVNSLGSNIKANNGPNTYPTSATAYYAYVNNTPNNLAHPWVQESRGHTYTIETDPTGAQTMHWFYQGEAVDPDGATNGDYNRCIPTSTSDPCFAFLRDGEFLKGQEYRTQVFPAGVNPTLNPQPKPLRETQQTFGVTFYEYGTNAKSGLWRAWSFPTQTTQLIYEGGTTAIGSTTRFCYDPANQGGAQYGQVTHVRLYNSPIAVTDNVVANCAQPGAAPLPTRITRQDYIALNTATSYIVDRVAQTVSLDNQGRLLALAEAFYDGSTTYKGIGTKGDLTLARAYYDVPLGPPAAGTLHSQDTSFGYDPYGNRTTESSYAGAGTRAYNGTIVTYSAPGAGSAARTTTTAYDPVMHAFSIQTTNPLGQITRADYDERMGTLMRVTGPNTTGTPTDCFLIPAAEESTCAYYDVFGRLTVLIKPGDGSTLPTVSMNYDDKSRPFRYTIDRRVQSGNTPVRQEQKFYDGLGRLIQTKLESVNGTQNNVVDTVYDGRDQAIKTSQPRYVNETSSSFVQYTPLAADATERWTQTTYDALGRPQLITAPDATTTEHFYGITGNLIYEDVVDPDHHRTQSRRDTLGRLVAVEEIAGTCSVNYWPAYACPTTTDPNKWAAVAETTYAYNPLDQLTGVTDDPGNSTQLFYDSLGRKTKLVDPDMGTWFYGSDANGNLISQRDGRGVPTTFTYDALGRMTSKFTNDGSVTTFSDSFDTKNATNWTWSTQQTVPFLDGCCNVVKSVGTDSNWGASFYRTGSTISSGEGVLLRFKVDATDPDAIFALETGSGTSYRRFSVIVNGGNIQVQVSLDGTTYPIPANLIAGVQTNLWYVLQLVADDVGGFTAQVYQESNPAVRGAYTMPMAAGQAWHFHHWIYRNTAYIDSYNERSAAVYGYDAGVGGKGQRTSMRNLYASTAWQYDMRGRKTRADHTVAGLSGTRTFQWTYDTADRMTGMTYPTAGGVAETLNYGYDEAWRPQFVCTTRPSTPCYIISSAQYTSLNQPVQWKFGNNLYQTWLYNGTMRRLSQVEVGTASVFGSLFNQSYTYDNAGNIDTIADNRVGQSQNFDYDHRDRLVHAWTTGTTTNAYNEAYTYDLIGNLTSKPGAGALVYPAAGAARPHTPATVGGAAYTYDLNGNLTIGGGRQYIWNTDNQPLRISWTGGTEDYAYDADGERVRKISGGTTTAYLEGLWEEVVGGAVTQYYSFGGSVVAQRDNSLDTLTYLHADHLGSIRVATDSSGQVALQDFTPWGKMRDSGPGPAFFIPIGLNYTGQRLDGSGLLYYHARYYDPVLGRFVSPDSVVPQPGDPQGLNRYSYANNNPILRNDPTGHFAWIVAGALVGAALDYGYQVYNNLQSGMGWGDALTTVNGGEILGAAALGAAAVIAAPLVVAAGGELLTGVGIATGSTTLFSLGTGMTGVAGALGAAVYGAAPAAGAGGDWTRFGEIENSSVAQQRTSLSCGAACGQGMLQDRGISTSQTAIESISGAPATADDLADALNAVSGSTKWVGGGLGSAPEPGIVRALSTTGSWSAMLHGGNRHWVVVDGINDAGQVLIRDPWGINRTFTYTGIATSYTMDMDEFLGSWYGYLVYQQP